MAKKLIPNPDYTEAPYELGFTDRHGQRVDGKVLDPTPHRFLTPYPDTIKTADELVKWVYENSIPSHIEVDE